MSMLTSKVNTDQVTDLLQRQKPLANCECSEDLEAVRGDERRLQALQKIDILDTTAEQEFEQITKMITLIFNVEIAIISFMDAHRQWYKSVIGMDTTEVELRGAFCRFTLMSGQPVYVPDATKDVRFANSPHVSGGPCVRFYAGTPLITSSGEVVGSICAISTKVRAFTEQDGIIFGQIANIIMQLVELRQMATTDTLTGSMTRRAFKSEAGKHLALAKRHKTPISCIMLDIDHFKNINDTYGHAAGDRVLVGVAHAATAQIRESDLMGRMGGEEFAIILPHTDIKAAHDCAEKLRNFISELRFAQGSDSIQVTASFGISTSQSDDDVDALLHRADLALYEAKHSGRNCSKVWVADDKKRSNRHRVLKSGLLFLANDSGGLDCTVRSVWDGGAELQVSTPLNMPEFFELQIRGDAAGRRRCSLLNRRLTGLEVAFI